jgi:zinc transport system substrate-binding protein
MRRALTTVTAALSTTLLLTACGDDGGSAGGDGGGLTVVASFYPLEYAAQRVAGDSAVEVVGLTAPGAEPHDLELSPRQVGTVQDSDLVVYSAGMQAAVDEAVNGQAADHSLDVSTVVDLAATGSAAEDHEGHEGESPEEHAEHEDESAEEHAGHDHGDEDPHFWLDPDRYALAVDAIAEELARLDPAGAETYRDNAEQFRGELADLDAEFADGLAECRQRTVVTTHEAFGYLTDKYGLEQVGITGLSPDAEPSPARMAEITHTVTEHGVGTIYAEVLVGGDLAEVIAAEAGAEVRVLDPVEGITDESAGSDYLEVMRANLETLREGQDCS